MGKELISHINEYQILFTEDVVQKVKKWKDGKLRYFKFNNKTQILNQDSIVISEDYLKNERVLQESDWGSEIRIGRLLVMIDSLISESERDISKVFSKSTTERKTPTSLKVVKISDHSSDISTSPLTNPTPKRRKVGLSRLATPSRLKVKPDVNNTYNIDISKQSISSFGQLPKVAKETFKDVEESEPVFSKSPRCVPSIVLQTTSDQPSLKEASPSKVFEVPSRFKEVLSRSTSIDKNGLDNEVIQSSSLKTLSSHCINSSDGYKTTESKNSNLIRRNAEKVPYNGSSQSQVSIKQEIIPDQSSSLQREVERDGNSEETEDRVGWDFGESDSQFIKRLKRTVKDVNSLSNASPTIITPEKRPRIGRNVRDRVQISIPPTPRNNTLTPKRSALHIVDGNSSKVKRLSLLNTPAVNLKPNYNMMTPITSKKHSKIDVYASDDSEDDEIVDEDVKKPVIQPDEKEKLTQTETYRFGTGYRVSETNFEL